MTTTESVTGKKSVNVTGYFVASIDWSDDLNNSTSVLYKSNKAIVKNEIESVLTLSAVVYSAVVEIIGFEQAEVGRKRRQVSNSNSSVNYQAVLAVDEEITINEIKKSIQEAVESADPSSFSSFESFDDYDLNFEGSTIDATTTSPSPKTTTETVNVTTASG